ncbi:MAG TPA: capreomycidine synthase [Herpetosiphonaceae bacterium]
MEIAPALLEYWLRDRYFTTELDISSSGVENFSFAELRDLVGITHDDLDQIVFRDSRSYGGPELRAAIAQRWGNGDPEHVMATHGSSEALFLIMQALLRPGDEVIVLDPVYHALYAVAEAIGCRLKIWRLRFEDQFVPDTTELRRLLSPQTRMVVVNFPHNPTGASVTLAQQAEIIEAVSEVGAYLIWDGAFTEITYDAPPLPDPTLAYHRAISVGTLSKAYGLPGLRVGWCIAAPEVLDRCIQLRDYMTLHLSPMVELIAQRAIEHADRLLKPHLDQARTNLALLEEWVAQHPAEVEYVRPKGGVSAFLRLPAVADTEAFCDDLASTQRVLLVPGNCFNHPEFVRIGFGGPTAELREGLARISEALRVFGQQAHSQMAAEQVCGTVKGAVSVDSHST